MTIIIRFQQGKLCIRRSTDYLGNLTNDSLPKLFVDLKRRPQIVVAKGDDSNDCQACTQAANRSHAEQAKHFGIGTLSRTGILEDVQRFLINNPAKRDALVQSSQPIAYI